MATPALGASTLSSLTLATSSISRASSVAGLSTVRFPNVRVSCSVSAESEFAESIPSVIDLQFLGPERELNGVANKDTVTVVSGEKVLRTVMNEQKLELYDLYGKLMNCGGGGSCGTCIVEDCFS